MKKNKMMRIASVLLVAVLLSACAISGTFAKYTTTVNGDDSARIAKWEIEVDTFKSASPANQTFEFDIFKTIYDTETPGQASNEDNVDSDLLAPGTWGYFDLVIKNNSEVTAKYTLTLTETIQDGPDDAASPILYSVNTVASTSEAATLPNSGMAKAGTNGQITITSGDNGNLNMNDGEAVIRIYWQWEFDAASNNDTALGLDGDTQIKVAANVTVEQVD